MLAGRVRQGTTPAISALAVVIIAVSIIGAIAFEVLRRREERRLKSQTDAAAKAELAEELIGTAAAH